MRMWICAVLACAVLAGCGKKEGETGGGGPSNTGGGGGGAGTSGNEGSVPKDGPKATGSQPGGSSPQDVFDKMKSAMVKKDFGGVYDVIDPEKAEELLVMMVAFGGMLGMNNEEAKKNYEAILKKHGIEEPKEGEAEEGKDPKAALKNVKDKRVLAQDIFEHFEKYGKNNKDLEDEAKATLKDVKEEGDTATGTIVQGDGKEKPVKFVKRGGRWYAVMD